MIERDRRKVERRIKAAKFPVVKSLDSFDFAAIPKLNKRQVLELARCKWIERRNNTIALGPGGIGGFLCHVGQENRETSQNGVADRLFVDVVARLPRQDRARNEANQMIRPWSERGLVDRPAKCCHKGEQVIPVHIRARCTFFLRTGQ